MLEIEMLHSVFFCCILDKVSEYDVSQSVTCTLRTEKDCILSFGLVTGEHGNVIYNSKLSGEFTNLSDIQSL